jgi:hypothetical protein
MATERRVATRVGPSLRVEVPAVALAAAMSGEENRHNA